MPRVFQGCSMDILNVVHRCFNVFFRLFCRWFKSVSNVFQRYFLGCFEYTSRLFQMRSIGLAMFLQWCSKCLWRGFHWCFKDIFQDVFGLFKRTPMVVPRANQWYFPFQTDFLWSFFWDMNVRKSSEDNLEIWNIWNIKFKFSYFKYSKERAVYKSKIQYNTKTW